jgi:radical SAM superfamily enzyme YgiQ (UPF0313 family)
LCATNGIGLVGIGAMTRMIAKAYRMADAVRAIGVPVVMGGPHVTEIGLMKRSGASGGPRHADAVALGEADETWPLIVNDAARQAERYLHADRCTSGRTANRLCKQYPRIPWESIDLRQFNLVPKMLAPVLQKAGGRLGNVPDHSRGVRTGLSLWLRILYRDGIFRRFDSLSHQSKRGR